MTRAALDRVMPDLLACALSVQAVIDPVEVERRAARLLLLALQGDTERRLEAWRQRVPSLGAATGEDGR